MEYHYVYHGQIWSISGYLGLMCSRNIGDYNAEELFMCQKVCGIYNGSVSKPRTSRSAPSGDGGWKGAVGSVQVGWGVGGS